MTAPFNPEELCDQTLIGSIRMLMKDDSVFLKSFQRPLRIEMPIIWYSVSLQI